MEKVKVFHVGNKKGLRKLIKLLDKQGVNHTLTKKDQGKQALWNRVHYQKWCNCSHRACQGYRVNAGC